jgi:hypothetical protein
MDGDGVMVGVYVRVGAGVSDEVGVGVNDEVAVGVAVDVMIGSNGRTISAMTATISTINSIASNTGRTP